MFMLGQCHMFGLGVPADMKTGTNWYTSAADQGSREAAFELGEVHAAGRTGHGVDLVEALRWWRVAARREHARACLKVAHCYRWGDAVMQDKQLAFAWYGRAAAAGNIQAHVWLGECYEHGDGAEADAAKAVEHYRKAANGGDAHALAELGRCILHGIGTRADPACGDVILRAAAEGGWTPALGELERYWFSRGEKLFGRAGVDPETAAEAVRCYRKAAELGHRRGALMLAECLRHGVGTPADLEQSVIWYRKAATLFDAKIALGDMYYYGWGVGRNEREAVRWYEQAVAQHEDAYAMYSLGYCLLHGHGGRRDARAALGLLRRSAWLGEADAQFELGSAYYRGAGANSNPRLAIKWLRSAATLGHAQAITFLARLESSEVAG
jgi:TPR repeat protein